MKQWFLLVFSFVFINSYAQTADEVITKYSTAMGSLDAFNKVTTVKMTGSMSTSGMVLPMTTQIIQGKAMRTDVDASGTMITTAYNNGSGWKINPLAGVTAKTDVTGAELDGFKMQTYLVNNLMDYKKRGHTVELLGEEMVEGVKTYKIKLTNKDDGKATLYFIMTADNLLLKTISKKEAQGETYDLETYYSDMKKINGLQFSMQLMQKIKGQVYMSIKWDKVELNVPVDEKIFVK